MKNTTNKEITAEKTVKHREFTGKVVSTAMAKSVVVEVPHSVKHALYKKAMRRSKKFTAHYEGSDIKVGDTVVIVETKPVSKTKHFAVKAKKA